MPTINRQPIAPTLHAADLLWLLDQWLTTQATTVNSDTLEGYRHKINYFRHWWTSTGPDQDWQLTKKDLGRFELHLRTRTAKQTGQPLSWHTRHDALRRLREMFLWAHQEGHTDHDYSSWVPQTHGAPAPRAAASVAHLHQLLTACAASDLPVRNSAIIALLIGTAGALWARRTECSNLQIENVVFSSPVGTTDLSGLANVQGKRTRANPSGQRQVAFDSTTGTYLLAYLKEKKNNPIGVTDFSGPLFVADNGQPLAAQGIYKAVKRVITLAKLEKVISGPHDLRRAFATHFARAHPDPIHADLLRRQLGHAHYSQTATYTLLDASDLVGHITSPLATGKKNTGLESSKPVS